MFLCRKRSSELKKTQFCTLVEQKITKSYPVCPVILHDVFYLVRQMEHFCVVFTWASFSRMVRMRITSDYGYGRKLFIWCEEERVRSGTVDEIETNRLTGITGGNSYLVSKYCTQPGFEFCVLC